MNEQNTVEKMRSMRMNAMAALYHQSINEHLYQGHTLDEYTALLVDAEWESRQSRSIKALMQRAGFKQEASASDIDYQSPRGLDKTTFERLLSLNFINKKENIIITGLAGCGKSFLSQSLGVKACQMLHKTLYYNTARFFDMAKLAKLQGTYHKMVRRIQKTELLILDDFGLVSIDQQARNVLMDIIEDRHERSSTIIATQIPVSSWHGLFGENTVADAILDRIVFSSHRIELEGESMRRKKRLSH
jgi:DNA replication protein DnaC